MHDDLQNSNHLLIDAEQEIVLDQLVDKLKSFIQTATNAKSISDVSLTYVPFYD